MLNLKTPKPANHYNFAERATALSFIFMVLLGNFWLVYYLFNLPTPDYLKMAIEINILWVLVQMFWMLSLKIIQFCSALGWQNSDDS